MAHFAQIEDGVVRQVTVVSNCAIGSCIGKEHWDYQEEYHKDHGSLDFPDTEPLGKKVLADSGFAGEWIQTSYNAKFRGKYAGVGDTWDGTNFVSPVADVPTA
jgi:hypothetical protein